MILDNRKTSLLVRHQLPEYIRDNADYSKFVDFLQAYYEWMEQNNNVLDRSSNILNYSDIDKTSEEFLQYYINDFLPYFPDEALVDKRTAVKFARQLYESKGTPGSYQLLFKMLYDCDFDIFYTKESVLRASDGLWYVSKSLRLDSNDINFLQTNNYRIFGETSKTIATIEKCVVSGDRTEVFISNMERTFLSGEFVRIVDSRNQDVLFSGQPLRAKILGQINQIRINPNNRGLTYEIGDPLVIYGGLASNTGIGATAEVGEITKGSLQDIVVNEGGFGFTANSTINIQYSGTPGQPAVAVIGSLNPTLLPQISVLDGGTGYYVNDPVYIDSDVLIGSVTSANSTGTIFKVSYNPGIDAASVLGKTAYVNSINPAAIGASIKIANVIGNGTANVNYISNNIISSANSFQINAANYTFFASHPTANANTSLTNSLSFLSFSTYPIGSVIVSQPGGDLQLKSVDATSVYRVEGGNYPDLMNLGILAPIQILNGGRGYTNTDSIIIRGGTGVGANARITSVDANGTITGVSYTTNGRYPEGGFGYKVDALPTITLFSPTATNTASLSVPTILGAGESLVGHSDSAGQITSIKITNYGEDYVATPNVSLKVMDILVNNIGLNDLPVNGDELYQGDDIVNAGFYSIVDSIRLLQQDNNSANSIYNIRVYNYTQAPDITQQIKIERPGSGEAQDLYLNIVGITVPENTYYSGSPYYENGVRIYGDGTARANASFLNGLTISQGQYLNSHGHLNSHNVLQDDVYNNFTYIITVEKEISKYREILLNLLHPTGLKAIGRFALKSESNFNIHNESALVQGRPLYYYTNDASSLVEMVTDFTNKSNNIILFKNLGAGVNIANIVFSNSVIELVPTNGPNVKSEVISVNTASNTVTLSTNTWLTFANVAYGTANNGQNTINIRSVTNAYDIINNGNYTDNNYPIKDIVFVGDQVQIGGQTRTVNLVDYANNTIRVTSNFTSNVSNSLFAVKRTFSAGGTLGTMDQVVIYGPIGSQYTPELTTTTGQTLTTEDERILLLG